MRTFRNILFQIHLWTGLIVGVFFIALGLSGSMLVYPDLLSPGAAAPKASGQGAPLPLETLIAAAVASAPQNAGRDATVTLPHEAGDAASVQFNAQRGAGRGQGRGPGQGQDSGPRGADGAQGAGDRGGNGDRAGGFGDRGGDRGGDGGGRGRGGDGAGRGGRGGRGGPAIYLDPVSGAVLPAQAQSQSPLLGLAHQLHESMLLGAGGRSFVGWLGVGMTFLGLSGLYLWWPKAGQWKYAFGVRRNARGARLYREIHGMAGIWFWIVFVVVSITGVMIAFPGLTGGRGGPGGNGPPPGFANVAAAPVTIDVPADAAKRPLDDLVKAAEKSSQGQASSIMVPAQANRPVTVTLAAGEEDGPPRTVQINPYSGAVIAQAGTPLAARPPQGLNARGLHQGQGLGPVYRFLVFLSGFLPLIFVTTGFLMWIKKRQARGAVGANRAS